MNEVAQQLLRALRGRRSQAVWARRLGYRGNPITDWENGRSFPTAEETVRAALRAGVDVERAFCAFEPAAAAAYPAGLAAWARQLCSRKPITELAQQLDCSRSAVSRWLSGKSKPRLPEFLGLVDTATGRVQDLLGLLVPIGEIPALAERHAAAEAARRLAFDAPWTEAILRLLETEDYQRSEAHDELWISRTLGIPSATCTAALALLAQAGVVQLSGNRYAVREALTVDTRGGKHALRALKAHWSHVAATRATDPQGDDHFAYNVMSVSHADFERIRELLRVTYREIRSIVSASHPAERVALLNLQLLSFKGGTPSPAELPGDPTSGRSRGALQLADVLDVESDGATVARTIGHAPQRLHGPGIRRVIGRPSWCIPSG